MEIKREDFLKALSIVNDYKEQVLNDMRAIESIERFGIHDEMELEDLNTSMRLYNILKAIQRTLPREYNSCSISQLNKLTTVKQLSDRNDCGIKTTLEYVKLLTDLGINPNYE